MVKSCSSLIFCYAYFSNLHTIVFMFADGYNCCQMGLTRILEFNIFFNEQVHGSFLAWFLQILRKKFHLDQVFDFAYVCGALCQFFFFCFNLLKIILLTRTEM